ncbi:MAG: glycoside hydrolase family 5 protein, partial [Lentisphaerae bacterium]|nr:glycoside hydrolase family 5 protein [Lentisphaerota bacterium]
MTMRNMTMAFLAMGAMAFAQVSSDTPGWVHFPVPGLELPAASAVDMGFLNAEPAGQNGFVRAAGEYFVDDRGVPLRFYGTNVTGTSCFPSVEDGRKLAKRLRQYGFNCLRLHFMDPEYNKEVIWEDANAGTLSAERLALLDHFVDALGREGVYANINLHVYRRYPGQPVP